jgi:uncharacterized membrane protein HdeD (DUF308 family)
MNKALSLALLVGGIILIIYGVSANDSLSGRATRFFTGSPTDHTIWMLLGGIVATLVGAASLFNSPKSP